MKKHTPKFIALSINAFIATLIIEGKMALDLLYEEGFISFPDYVEKDIELKLQADSIGLIL